MKAVVCHETKLEVEEVPIPFPDRARCCSRWSAAASAGRTCTPASTPTSSPTWPPAIGYPDVMRPHESVVMGHEFSGRVLDYGPGTREAWSTGTPVVSLPMIRMGEEVQMTGLSAKAPGAYAERVLVQESLTMDVPNGLSPETAALTEPMAVAWHAVRTQRGAQEGDRRRDRLRPDRARRDPDAQGARRAARRSPATSRPAVARSPSGAAPTWSSTRASTRRGRSFEESSYITDANDALRPRARHDGQAAQGAEAAVVRRCCAPPRPPARRRSGPVVFECVGVPGIIDQIINARRSRPGSSWSACAWSRTRSSRRWRSTRRSTCGSSSPTSRTSSTRPCS